MYRSTAFWGDTAPGFLLADAIGWNHMNGWAWGTAVFGWLFLALIGLVVGLCWSTTNRRPVDNHAARARDVLDDRYARGKIDRDEYLERRADLEH